MYRVFIVIAFLAYFSAPAQEELYDGEEGVLTRYLQYGGVTLHSNGFGAFYHYGWNVTAHKSYLLGVEAVTMKHDKEIKTFNPGYPNDSKSYVYGKLNNFYILRPTLTIRNIIADKLRYSGVQVGYVFQTGPSLGITKPVYLEIGYPSFPYEYIAVEKYDPNKHYLDDIFGRASGLNGLNELKLHPGWFAKFGLNFEYSNERYVLKGLEAGVAFDGYLRDIPIMADFEEPNKQLFLTFYLNFFIGSKFNKQE